ncbi:unnamed protein product, partial [Rotaria sp. Silwood2]
VKSDWSPTDQSREKYAGNFVNDIPKKTTIGVELMI